MTRDHQIIDVLTRARTPLTSYEVRDAVMRDYPGEPVRFLWWSWRWPVPHMVNDLARLYRAGRVKSAIRAATPLERARGDGSPRRIYWVAPPAIRRNVGKQMSSRKSPPLVIDETEDRR